MAIAGQAPGRAWGAIGFILRVADPPLLAGACAATAMVIAFRQRAVATEGRIVEMRAVTSEAVRSAGDMRQRETLSYVPVFAFVRPDRREVRAEGSFASNPPCCAVGDAVTVR
jgi:hypothetical protein